VDSTGPIHYCLLSLLRCTQQDSECVTNKATERGGRELASFTLQQQHPYRLLACIVHEAEPQKQVKFCCWPAERDRPGQLVHTKKNKHKPNPLSCMSLSSSHACMRWRFVIERGGGGGGGGGDVGGTKNGFVQCTSTPFVFFNVLIVKDRRRIKWECEHTSKDQ
jgi:hypothetical protein